MPDAEIAIVDSYSTDGTWEKLLELRKDYNLKLYRYKCTRGLGRHIALCKCPENSTTAYFDLDTVYNQAFHKLVEYGASTGLVVYSLSAPNIPCTIVVKREALLSKGGWKDLNFAEDWEVVSRVGFDAAVPVAIGCNAPASTTLRERRYGGWRRVVETLINIHRGEATSLEKLLVLRSKRLTLTYIPARIIGLYRNRKPDNVTWIELASLARLIPLQEMGILDKYFSYTVSPMLLRKVKGGEETIDNRVLVLVSKPVFKVWWKARWIKITYFKDYEWLDKSYMPLVEKIGVLK